MRKIDLHTHTNYSDGSLDLISLCELIKLESINDFSITDHDTIIGLKNFEILNNIYGFNLIPGIEISCDLKTVHMLGYGILDFDQLEKELNNVKNYNLDVCYEVIRRLNKNNISISIEEIEENMKLENENHIKLLYNSLINNNKLEFFSQFKPSLKLLDKREIVKVLIQKNYAQNVKEAYDKYIGKNAEHYVPIKKITTQKAIEMILESGGVPVLAHPFTYRNIYEIIPELIFYGLKGIEYKGTNFMVEQTDFYKQIANENNLILTAGSDFHNFNQSTVGIFENDEIINNLNNEIVKQNKIYLKKNVNIK